MLVDFTNSNAGNITETDTWMYCDIRNFIYLTKLGSKYRTISTFEAQVNTVYDKLNSKEFQWLQNTMVAELVKRKIKFETLTERDFDMILMGVEMTLKIQKRQNLEKPIS